MNKEQSKKYPETKKFLDWYLKAKDNGLQDVKFFPHSVEGATVESFFAVVNTAINAEAVKLPEL